MERPGERIRLKDRIVDNISKSIKSIQELVFYQYKDLSLTGDDSVVLYSHNHLCHKLCENLDHTLLHGLKHVIKGYWRVVKQLSPHAMVKEIDMLRNVTTDLGKGRAWLYVSLNEGLLESYIKMLCDNDTLVKKYYAKEALVLDKGRMSVLLTLASGLDCVTFRLDYDVPYLDLNAYPPRSRKSLEQEGNGSSDSSNSYLGHPSRYRSRSEVFASPSVFTSGVSSDSDSISLASLDAQSPNSSVYQSKVSTISADSGFPADINFNGRMRKHSLTTSEAVIISDVPNGIFSSNASASSLTSLVDKDKHQRLENVFSGCDKIDGQSLEVIHVKNKKVNGCNIKKKTDDLDKNSQRSFNAIISIDSHCDMNNQEIGENSSNFAAGRDKFNAMNITNRSGCSSSVTGYNSSLENLKGHLPTLGAGVAEHVLRCDSVLDGSLLPVPVCDKSLASGSCTSAASDQALALPVKNNHVTPLESSYSFSSLDPDNTLTSSEAQKVLVSLGSAMTSTNSESAKTSPDSGMVMTIAGSGCTVISAGSGSAMNLINTGSAMNLINTGSAINLINTVSAMISTSSGSAMNVINSRSEIISATSGSAMTLSSSVPVNPPTGPQYFPASVKNEHSTPLTSDMDNGVSTQEYNSSQINSNLFPLHVGATNLSPAPLFTNSQYLEPTDANSGSCVASSTPDIADQIDRLSCVLNSTAQIIQTQAKTDPAISYQKQIAEPSTQQSNDTRPSHHLGHKRDIAISQGNGNEQPGQVFSLEEEDSDDFYATKEQRKAPSLSKISEDTQDGVCTTQGSTRSLTENNSAAHVSDLPQEDEDQQGPDHGHPDMSLRLDNNTILELMLTVFTLEDEKLVKTFVTWKNHTEGDTTVVYIFISDQCLYVAQYQCASRKFVRQSCTQLTDIIFIGAGMSGQALNIESRGKNKQKQRLWLSPGSQRLSQSIVTCLADAVRTANEHVAGRARFSVGSEVPLHKIALRKFVSGELGCKPQDVTLWDYSLVFWEDLSMDSTGCSKTIYKEGALHLSYQDPVQGPMWKPVYVVLKNSTLCIKNSKQDLGPHSYLSLAGDQCVGCRLTCHAGEDNCVELILSSKGSWLLKASSQAEISEWGHSLCLAVSQGTMETGALAFCVPCCAVLSCDHLFLCHENLYNKFYRTLGRCQLKDVASVVVDGGGSSYCIINLKTPVASGSSCQWVMYFNSAEELERHLAAFSSAWKDVHKAELPLHPLDDAALQFYCRTNLDHLKQQLTLS